MRRAFAKLPSLHRVKQLLDYDAATGYFVWRQARGPNAAGATAGWAHKSGYTYVSIDGKSYKAHRLAWLFVHGRAPNGLLDHIDRDPKNNRISNLREVSEHQNNQNKCLYRNNVAGAKGVGWLATHGKWRVRIQASGRVHFLGLFDTFEAALQARRLAEQKLHITQERGL